jgi:hypothetical protein
LLCFTALGEIKVGDVNSFDMGNGFIPYRREVNWYQIKETSIISLLPILEFTRQKNWGFQLRFGLVEISVHDLRCISHAMRVKL